MGHDPIYAIGDIHGHLDQLQTILQRIETDGGPDALIVFVGDYTDRGPASKAVIELLANGLEDGRNWVCLKGNHDRMFSMFMEPYPRNDARLLVGYHWLHARLGGIETLASYGVPVPDGARIFEIHAEARHAVPERHVEFLQNLPTHHLENGFLFVHAGIRPDVPLEAQTEDDLIWIRNEFLSHEGPHPFMIVHGHSHVDRIDYRQNRINIDTGAGHGRALSCIVIEDGQIWEMTADGRHKLTPQP